jgi:hypothetical protein
LVWVTGNSGAGRSTACAALRARGRTAVDAHRDGYDRRIHRVSGEIVTEPPHPATRTNNTVGRRPEELAAALRDDPGTEAMYRRHGATIIDSTLPPSEVTDLVLARASS